MNEIIDCSCGTVQFDTIKQGECFVHCGELYIKINNVVLERKDAPHFNSVRLKDGCLTYMFNDNRVEKVDTRIQCFHSKE